MIQLDRVTVHRGGLQVLHDISADIPTGGITAVVGPSGVGKTTLLSTLNGLLLPSSGAITVEGVGVLDSGEKLQDLRRQTATVFQEHALIDRLTALDNVLLGLADQRHPLSPLPWSRSMRLRAAEALDQVGMLQRATARAAQLSGGERQRVGVARALVRQPRLLLGDEPFSSVDPALVRQIGRTLRDMVDRVGTTVILVMHQMETALSLADKVIALAGGRIAYAGEPAQFDHHRQNAVFGSPSLGAAS